jgi:hypothetical protein
VPKKNILFLAMGPPTLPPYCFSLNVEYLAAVLGAFRSEVEGRPVELVAAALGDGVDAAARESALPDVVRRHDELELGDRVEADRLRLGRPARSARGTGQAEQVVVRGAVDLEAVVAEARPGDRHHRRAVARQRTHRVEHGLSPRDVVQAPRNRRERIDGLLVDVDRRSGARRIDGRGLGHHGHGFLHRRERQRKRDRPGLAETNHDVVDFIGLETTHRGGQLVGSADADLEDGKPPIRLRRGLVGGARWLVDGHDGGSRHDGFLSVHDHAEQVAGRHVLTRCGLSEREQRERQSDRACCDGRSLD